MSEVLSFFWHPELSFGDGLQAGIGGLAVSLVISVFFLFLLALSLGAAFLLFGLFLLALKFLYKIFEGTGKAFIFANGVMLVVLYFLGPYAIKFISFLSSLG